ncbi:MAG TPA: pyridoxal-dependent decarboxylase [Rhodothermales bacterium]|nr:pyridoxal-dependent decarboxylase [Rhodothermales bacterium]
MYPSKDNTQTLDFSLNEFQGMLDQTFQMVMGFYRHMESLKGFNAGTPEEMAALFDAPLPEDPQPLSEVFDEIREKVVATATGNFGKHMYAYVMSGGNQVSTLADLIMTTLNQNNTKWHLAPAMTEIERRVVKWAATMIGFTDNAGGAMVSAGSEANLAGLTVARNTFFKTLEVQNEGLFGVKPFILYASEETHNCIDKSMALLGLGRKYIRKIPTHANFTIRLDVLESQIKSDLAAGLQPFCIVGNAGTVNTGAIDPLESLALLAQKYQLWFHVDGAYGGLASGLPELRAAYRGIALADSIALDFHKWLYQPFEVGCVLVRDWQTLRASYHQHADYLDNNFDGTSVQFDFNDHYFQLSRNAKAFKVWTSIKVYGFERFRAMIRKDISLTQYLKAQVEASPDFEWLASGPLAVGCFRYRGTMVAESEKGAFNQRLVPALEADGRVFIMGTKLKGQFALRACLINHRKDHAAIDYLLSVIREVAEKQVPV